VTPRAEPEASGWLRPADVVDLLATVFGQRVSTRAVLHWTQRVVHPLPSVKLGSRVLVHREALMAWVMRNGKADRDSADADG
jgi:hypothetical protein